MLHQNAEPTAPERRAAGPVSLRLQQRKRIVLSESPRFCESRLGDEKAELEPIEERICMPTQPRFLTSHPACMRTDAYGVVTANAAQILARKVAAAQVEFQWVGEGP